MRGAPAIGVTGALALAVHLIAGGRGRQYSSVQACLDDVTHTMDYLVTRWAGRAGMQLSRGSTQGPSPCRRPHRACSSAPCSCSRPTAVNLSDSAVKLKAVAAAAAAQPGATAESVTAAVITAAEATMQEDIDANKVRCCGNTSSRCCGHLLSSSRSSAEAV